MSTRFLRIRIGIIALITTFVIMNVCAPVSFASGGLTRIADNIYSYVNVKNAAPQNSFGANAGIIIGRDGIVVVDTLISAKKAKKFIKDIRAITDKPVKYVVNTHTHLDHTFGNCEFAALGAAVVASVDERRAMELYAGPALENAAAYGLTEQDMKGTGICYPGVTFERRMVIDLGDLTVELIHPGHSHTEGSIIVFVPDRKVLFAGDMLFTNYHPNLTNGDLTGWAGALDALAAMDFDVLVPGHGSLSGKTDIENMKNYLILFDEKAKELTARSSDLDFIVSELKKALPTREELDMLVGVNVKMRYMKQ